MEKQTATEEFNRIENGGKVAISEDTVNQFRIYQETYHGNYYTMDQARRKLEANYRKEEETVPSKEVALKAMNAVRLVCPKVDGLEQREAGTLAKISEAQQKAERALNSVSDIENTIVDLKKRVVYLELQLSNRTSVFKRFLNYFKKLT